MRLRTRIALAVAPLWSVGLLVTGLVVPVSTTRTETSGTDASGAVTTSVTVTGVSLVHAEGPWVLALLALPLVATLAVVVALVWLRPPARQVVAWLGVGVCLVLGILGMLTIGPLVLPVTVALAVAAMEVRSARAQ